MNYQPTIGLEIHAELKTKTKMFCSCLNDSEEKRPNFNVCPICLAHPGTLPTINFSAVSAVIKVGLALGGVIPPASHFDRKSYFYPDLPKGYQISQYEDPLVKGGNLAGVRIRRVHLEEDTGRLLHQSSHLDGSEQSASLVDFNRAGLPLMELVTEPDIKSAEEAVKFAQELQLILRYLNVSDADMEKGQMRVEANVSLNMGTKVELKNINSFKAASAAIDYEINRQTNVLESGEKVIQETRGWDDIKGATKSQRLKESAHDYRYFPEPDLPPLDFSSAAGGFDLEKIKLEIPELPEEKKQRFMKEYGLDRQQTEMLAGDRFAAEYFESAASELQIFAPKLTPYNSLYNYLTSDLRGLMAQENIGFNDLKVKPEHLAHLVFLAGKGDLSSRMVKDILLNVFNTGLDPQIAIEKLGGVQIQNESELETIAKEILVDNVQAIGDYKKGKQSVIQFLIGKAMKKSQGRVKPEILKKIFDKLLK